MNNNPSPGNKLGGLTTILEKSLGAAAKGGTTPLNAVYEYAEPVTAKGFVFMDTPGYDPGVGDGPGGRRRQRPLLHHRPRLGLWLQADAFDQARHEHADVPEMDEDMDINCGDVLDGVTMEDKGRQIFDRVLEVASGTRTKSEELGYGDAEFVPWQIGATM